MYKSTKTTDGSDYILPTKLYLYEHDIYNSNDLNKKASDESPTQKITHSYPDWTHKNQESCVDSVHENKPSRKSGKKIDCESTTLLLQSNNTQIRQNNTKSEMCQLKHNILDKGKVKMMQFRNVFNNIANGLKLSKERASVEIPDTN